jgi:hypothetical protein
LIDYAVILPRAHALYAHAAGELNQPELLTMIRGDWPVYAWSYDQRHVWTTTRAPLAMRTLRKLLARTDRRGNPAVIAARNQAGTDL